MTTATEEVTVEALQAELDALRRSVAEDRAKIVEVAREAAQQNGLCEVVDRALERAGLLGGEQYTIEAMVPIRVVTHIDTFADKQQVQDMINAHKADIENMVVRGLGHFKALSYGNARRGDAQVVVNGDVEVISMTPGAPPRNVRANGRTNARTPRSGWANPPQGYLALYTEPYGRTVHFVQALEPGTRRARRVTVDGVEFEVSRDALCHGTGYISGWQVTSPRAQNVGEPLGICQECRTRAVNGFRWAGPR
jgi:hypothetical protein